MNSKMPSQLPVLPIDCLKKIFECLDDNKVALHSCLLVSRLWCRVSVEILWRNIWDTVLQLYQLDALSKIFNTLIACLPNESKELLFNKGVFIPTPTSKFPLFNYPSFCKVLSILDLMIIDDEFKKITTNHESFILLRERNYLIAQEMLKMFMKEIPSLKKLVYYSDIYGSKIPNFINFSGARDCLKNLSEMRCSSNINSEFFYQLSKICHNIQSLTIEFSITNLDGLNDLIFSQNSLKSLSVMRCIDYDDKEDIDCAKIVPSLTKHANTLTKLFLQGISKLSFLPKFTNLQELDLSSGFEDFKELQYVIFPYLEILKLYYGYEEFEMLIKFLENNGRNLREFNVYGCNSNNSLNLAIAKFCPNLRSLYTQFKFDEVESLAVIFSSCQQLESFKTLCDKPYFEGKKLLEIVAKYSPKNFHELTLCNYVKLRKDDLESFFINWKTRIPQKSLSFIVNDSKFIKNSKNKKIIRKYKNLGIIKKFE
ncbi:hypothetical protein RhiirC2_786967 [Rhizophagus irregularis]|uniref:F-box domain-containing protein n=1 Tax=Rhizophagus irregularis TaxID=588596 RepID=A0A2N1MT94_9GLOM|nr:hypothetical protein RhiirC2_786967 [Rhizophagus irregularis]